MPIRTIEGTRAEYFLISYDKEGKEVNEACENSACMSEALLKRLTDQAHPYTDIFFASHGWKGDMPAAIEQYDRWFATMASMHDDIEAVRKNRPDFHPLIVGLHWPSLPWGEESVADAKPSAKASLLGVSQNGMDANARDAADLQACSEQIADTRAARDATRTILAHARQADKPALTPTVREAYSTLFAESGLRVGSVPGRPGSDQYGFDPDAVIGGAATNASAKNGQNGNGSAPRRKPGTLGASSAVDSIRDAILMPMRQLSFWKMKDRARKFGERGAHDLVKRLQLAAPETRVHLMGHSFGCIVASAAVAGPVGVTGTALPRPVDSLFLVQGALSLWSYGADIPYAPGAAGYFHRIIAQGLVRGPLVTTRSKYDTAVGRFYPLGAEVAGQLLLGEEYPAYGGIGTFGIRGVADASDMVMRGVDFAYHFGRGHIYNLDADGVIRNGSGPSGAHSDIAHPEVAHAFWSAVAVGNARASRLGVLGENVIEPSIYWNDIASSVQQTEFVVEPSPAPSSSRGRDLSKITPTMGLSPFDEPHARPGLLGELTGRVTATETVMSRRPPNPRGPRDVRSVRSTKPARPAKPMKAKAGKPPKTAKPDKPARWINAEIEGRDPAKGLASGNWYTLAFDIDVKQRAKSSAVVPFAALNESGLFPDDVDDIVLTVQIVSDDFELSGDTAQIRLPRVGRSYTKARFDIMPRRAGPARITAVIHKDGNFIQQMTLTFQIGSKGKNVVKVKSLGRPLSSAGSLQKRDVGLSIARIEGGYECRLWHTVMNHARLLFEPAYIANAVDVARNELMKVVGYRRDAQYVFQEAISIDPKSSAAALETLANAGAALFRKLFHAPGAAADSTRIGDTLRKLAMEPDRRLNLQIVADRVSIPWGLLYLGPVTKGAKLDWDHFLGMRHVIEQIPLQNSDATPDNGIRSHPRLAVSINLNEAIDTQMESDFVEAQRAFWRAIPGVTLALHTTTAELLDTLGEAGANDQLIYLYCHAVSKGLNDPGGPDASYLSLTDADLTLGDLQGKAPVTEQLKGNPLVFLNACESADMSPAFYDGFVPYFMDKGARGVIGTECKTPALFAMEWAKQFFARFLAGEPLGEAFLNLRREFRERDGNPLGLLYAVHCDSDTRVDPAMQLTTSSPARRSPRKTAPLRSKQQAPRRPSRGVT